MGSFPAIFFLTVFFKLKWTCKNVNIFATIFLTPQNNLLKMACSNWSFQMFCSKWSPQNVCSKFSSSKWCAHNGLLKMVCSKRSAQNGLFTQSSKRLLLVPSHFWPICPVILNFGMHFRPPCERAHCRASYVCAQILIFGPVGPPKCPVILNLEWALWRTVL